MALAADRHFETFRRQCIAGGEREHEAALAEFPHRVQLRFDNNLDANCDRMVAIEEFLLTVMPAENFRAFPGTSVGRFKEDIFCVFFRYSRDAVIMKLTL